MCKPPQGRKSGYKDLNTMARVSVESAKAVITTLLSEQERDRDSLQRMLSHSQKMTEALLVMRDQEEHRIDTEAAEPASKQRRGVRPRAISCGPRFSTSHRRRRLALSGYGHFPSGRGSSRER